MLCWTTCLRPKDPVNIMHRVTVVFEATQVEDELFTSLLQIFSVSSFSAVSSMRAGPAAICTASKMAWVPWSRARGSTGWMNGTTSWGFNLEEYYSFIHYINCFRRHIYGPNLIDVPVKSYMQLLVEEVRLKMINQAGQLMLNRWNHLVVTVLFALFPVDLSLCFYLSFHRFLLGPQPFLCVPSFQHYPVDGW